MQVSYSNNIDALIMKPHYGICRVRVLALFALHGEKHLESCGDAIVLLSDNLPLLMNLKQRF